jgi:hypothetical protein
MINSQSISSKHTSVNKSKLPTIYSYVDWSRYKGLNVLDYGAGKFDNVKIYMKDNYNINLYTYDKYNRTEDENIEALNCIPSAIICANVLNVIKEDYIVQSIVDKCLSYNVLTFFQIYEGSKSGIGSISKKDCWQRNEKVESYLQFFKGVKVIVVKNYIIKEEK